MNQPIEKTAYTLKLSFPIFIELLLQLLVGNVDQFMVSHISQDSVAAIGNANQLVNIVIIVLNVMSMATTILITRYIGANDRKGISTVCSVSVVMSLVSSVLATSVLVFFCRPLFGFLQVPASVMEEAVEYTTIVGGFLLVQGLYMTFAAILRSYSFTRDVMFVSLIMNLMNIGGNVILINGYLGFPKLGIVGAAISTNISKCIGLVIVFYLFCKKTDASIGRRYLKPFPFSTLKRLLSIGLPSGGEELSYNLSQMCILRFVNFFGTSVIATKVYCSMLANIAYVYSIAIAQATQIVIGYFIGMKLFSKIAKRVHTTVWLSMAISTCLTAIMYINSDAIFGIFTSDAEILALGKQILLIEFFLEIGRSVNISMVRCLIAVGDIKFPFLIGLGSSWLVATGGAYVLGVVFQWGLVGIWVAMAIDECLRGLLFLIRFKQGAWKGKMQALPAPAGAAI